MTENENMSEVIAEVKHASEDELREVIEKQFDSIRTAGMRVGAKFIAAAVYGAIEKNIKTGSLRDYQRATKAVMDIVSVQLKQEKTVQNDLELPEDENV